MTFLQGKLLDEHPECKEGETFIGNAPQNNWDNHPHVRRGTVAYEVGTRYTKVKSKSEKVFPYFAQREYFKNTMTLKEVFGGS